MVNKKGERVEICIVRTNLSFTVFTEVFSKQNIQNPITNDKYTRKYYTSSERKGQRSHSRIGNSKV